MRNLVAALSLAIASSSVAIAGEWQNWRGPNFNGSTDETKLPEQFSKTENVAWSVDLPGIGSATPIVSGNHVFMSSTDKDSKSVVAICFDRKTGKKLWQHEVAKGIRKDTRSTFAAPSATTDGDELP